MMKHVTAAVSRWLIAILALFVSSQQHTTSSSSSIIGIAAAVAEQVDDERQQCTAAVDDDASCRIRSSSSPQEDNTNECGLYMAESAIPNSGLGMYTARAIPKGERIFYGDVVVQVQDMDLNTKLRHWATIKRKNGNNNKKWLLHHYYWEPAITLGVFEADSVESIIPGLGMLANSHTGLVNARERAPSSRQDDWLRRGQDPGAGASSTYHDMHFCAAADDIPVGSELYVQYGDDWFADRSDELGPDIPLSNDFRVADATVQTLWQIILNRNKRIDHDESKKNEELVITDVLYLIKNITFPYRRRLAAAFPNDSAGLQQAVQKGTATLTVPNQIRSIAWLQEHGQCLDNIRPGVSTIRQAGRGAFATRHLAQGTVIAPMPLVQVRRHHMEIYDSDDDYNNIQYAKIWKDGTQLLLNYCYGHYESSLLLFPYSPVVNYVNHANSTGANAKLRWSTTTLSNHHHRTDWLQRSPAELDTEDHAGLIMEMVATRDIHAGEEVFLNYGSRWESSWNDYVASNHWKNTQQEYYYVSAAELNHRRLEPLKTVEEQKLDAYYQNYIAENVFTVCFIDHLDDDDTNSSNGKSRTFQWHGSKEMFNNADYAYPCEILERHDKKNDKIAHHGDRKNNKNGALVDDDDVRYTVLVELNDDDEEATVEGVPRSAIQFFDQKYKSDNMIRGTFRHEIELPDEMVPDAWRDLRR